VSVWKVLCATALLVSLGGAVVAVFANEDQQILLFCLLAVLLYTALWIGRAAS
jgi:hypothetical protein